MLKSIISKIKEIKLEMRFLIFYKKVLKKKSNFKAKIPKFLIIYSFW